MLISIWSFWPALPISGPSISWPLSRPASTSLSEKPVAVDPPGITGSVIKSAELAKQKGLGIIAGGPQRRHQAHYVEILKRIHNGDVGEIVSGQCYWNMGALWIERAKNNWENRKSQGWSEHRNGTAATGCF